MKTIPTSVLGACLTCKIPPTAVADTTSTYATVVGDLLGDIMANIANLIKMPYGCGEQNMLAFVPNIVVLIYLEVNSLLTEPLRSKIIKNAEFGYQNQLNYRRSDGSFSAWGKTDQSGSTWLTAYVIKSFIMAKLYILIDNIVIESALSFLISKQNPDGSFRDDGRIITWNMQGGAGVGVPLTAYIAIVLSENINAYPQFKVNLEKALTYINSHLNADDVYALSISSYAFYLSNHANFTALKEALLSKAIETADQLRWQKTTSTNPNEYVAINVEIASYALMLMTHIDSAKASKIVKFLVTQKNAFGGYSASQDTVVAIRALALFSTKFRTIIGTLNLNMKPNVAPPGLFTAQVTSANILTLQRFDLNPMARQLCASSGAGSVGSAIVSFTCNYYELIPDTSPRFNITVKPFGDCYCLLKLKICLNYIPKNSDVESNMALMTLTLPSGYTYDFDTVLPKFIRVRKLF